ncbi:hypothetical protein [Caudoviricetes sp.]|nr:hypothetical protein [Caudoviricetes sp.]UOF79142.1 hypothetical protein [Caudoviricetes sp.]
MSTSTVSKAAPARIVSLSGATPPGYNNMYASPTSNNTTINLDATMPGGVSVPGSGTNNEEEDETSVGGGTKEPGDGMDIIIRYTPGNIIETSNGVHYQVVKALDDMTDEELKAVGIDRNGKVINKAGSTAVRVKGRDGRVYVMIKLPNKETAEAMKKSQSYIDAQKAIEAIRPPPPGAAAGGSTEGEKVAPGILDPNAAAVKANVEPWNPNMGSRQAGKWWTTEWWNAPGYHKRMY